MKTPIIAENKTILVIKIVLFLQDKSEIGYTDINFKESGISKTMFYRVMKDFEQKGLVEKFKKSYETYFKLTEKGEKRII